MNFMNNLKFMNFKFSGLLAKKLNHRNLFFTFFKKAPVDFDINMLRNIVVIFYSAHFMKNMIY